MSKFFKNFTFLFFCLAITTCHAGHESEDDLNITEGSFIQKEEAPQLQGLLEKGTPGANGKVSSQSTPNNLQSDLKSLIKEEPLILSNQAGLSNLENLESYKSITLKGSWESFEFLTKASNIKNLRIYNSRLTPENLNTLAGLVRLNKLIISNAFLPDFSFLSHLINLKELILLETNIKDKDLHHLANLTNLTALELPVTFIEKFYDLHLTKLKLLNLASTKIEDVSILNNLTDLEELVLENTPVSDISSLTLKKLKKVNLIATKIKDFSGLKRNNRDLEIITHYPRDLWCSIL